MFLAFLTDEQGATAIEYALIASLISVAAITSLSTVGQEVSRSFSAVASSLQSANAR